MLAPLLQHLADTRDFQLLTYPKMHQNQLFRLLRFVISQLFYRFIVSIHDCSPFIRKKEKIFGSIIFSPFFSIRFYIKRAGANGAIARPEVASWLHSLSELQFVCFYGTCSLIYYTFAQTRPLFAPITFCFAPWTNCFAPIDQRFAQWTPRFAPIPQNTNFIPLLPL